MLRATLSSRVLFVFGIAGGALAACSSPATFTPARSAPTTAPTSAPAASATPIVGATPTVTPVASISPTPSPTATATVTPVPTATASLSPAPANYLTGYYNEVGGTNQITQVLTTMTVPAQPPHAGTVFLWPGLDPVNGPHYYPINNGVLQPVLTWGPSCAPGTQPATYSTWWVSGQYVNTIGSQSGYTGCQGGAIMSVNVGDTLVETMSLGGTTWTQTIMDVQTGATVSYAINMMMQEQQIAYFVIEGYGQAPVGAVTFTNTSFTFTNVPASGCGLAALTTRSPLDSYSAPVVSNGGLTCSIANITIYAPYSTVATTMNRGFHPPYSGQVNGRR